MVATSRSEAATRQASESAGQAATAAAQLSTRAEDLQRLVGQFRLVESGSGRQAPSTAPEARVL